MTWGTASCRRNPHANGMRYDRGWGSRLLIDAFIYDLTRSIGQIRNIPEFEVHLKERLEAFYEQACITLFNNQLRL